AIARSQDASNEVAGKMLPRRCVPGDGLHAVEAKQAELRTEPEITVGRVGEGSDCAFEKPLADGPRLVGVLTDVELGIQRESARTPRQQQASQRANPSASSARPHGYSIIIS